MRASVLFGLLVIVFAGDVAAQEANDLCLDMLRRTRDGERRVQWSVTGSTETHQELLLAICVVP